MKKTALDFRVYCRGKLNLVIFPDIPQWIILDKLGLQILKECIISGIIIKDFIFRFPQVLHQGIKKTYGELRAILKKRDGSTILPVERSLTSNTTVAMISVTRRCNLKNVCPHCYVDAQGIIGPEMTLTDHRNLAQQIHRCMATNSETNYKVNLTGGEPFIHRQILGIIQAYHDAGFKVNMSTNGLVIQDSDFGKLLEYGVTLSISLDGSRAETYELIRGKGTFLRTIKQIRKLTSRGIRVGVNYLVHSQNIADLENTVSLAYELGCTGFNPINLVQLGRACTSPLWRARDVEIFSRLATYLKNHPKQAKLFDRTSLFSSMGAALLAGVICNSCGVGNRPCIYITPEGDVFPCANTQRTEFLLGNIKKTPLKQCLKGNHPVIVNLRKLQIDNLNPLCSRCDVRKFCGGDCRGETFSVTGNIRAPYVACQDRHDSIIELMWIVSQQPEIFETRANEYLKNALKNA